MTEPSIAPPIGPASPLAKVSSRPGSLIGASLELLARSGRDLRAASFYIGMILLVTVVPVAVLGWATEVVGVDRSDREMETLLSASGYYGWFSLATLIAVCGAFVASIESQAVAIALLGSRLEDRPLTVRDAVRRARQSFWTLVRGGILVSVPLALLSSALQALLPSVFAGPPEFTSLTASFVTAVVGVPFAFVQAGIVLGAVGALESVRRSMRLFRAAPASALVVSLFSSAAQLLIVAGIGAGVEIPIRILDALGLTVASGGVGATVTGVLVVVLVFALGTLVFTVTAIAAAPQVVLFLALTHATPGLQLVRAAPEPPIDAAPGHDAWRRPERPFRWMTRPLIATGIAGALLVVGGIAALANR